MLTPTSAHGSEASPRTPSDDPTFNPWKDVQSPRKLPPESPTTEPADPATSQPTTAMRPKLQVKTPANDPSMRAQPNLTKEDYDEMSSEAATKYAEMQKEAADFAKNPEKGEAACRDFKNMLNNMQNKVGKNSEIGKEIGRMKDKMEDQLNMFSERASQNMMFDWIKSFIETLQQCAKDCASASTKR